MGFWIAFAIVMGLVIVALWIGYSKMRPARAIRALLAREIPVPTRPVDPETLYTRPFPPRLKWNWTALILGPFWYFIQGLWVHGFMLLALVFVSGGLFLPLVWLYAGLKADEDLLEFSISRRSVY